MNIIGNIKPLIDKIKSTEDPDEKIFYAVSFLENENNIKELSDEDYILISKEIVKIHPDAQLAAEIAKVIIEKKSLHSFAQELIKDKSKYTGDQWSFDQFDEIQKEAITMISEKSDILFIESNTMLGDNNDWGAPEVEQWEGIYKGYGFLLDRIYEAPQEKDVDGHIYYDSFRWDWAELPSDEIVDSMVVISDKICDSDFICTPWSLLDNNISENPKAIKEPSALRKKCVEYSQNTLKEITINEIIEYLYGLDEYPDTNTPLGKIRAFEYDLIVTHKVADWINNNGLGCYRPEEPDGDYNPNEKEMITISAEEYIDSELKNDFLAHLYNENNEDGVMSKSEIEEWINQSIRECIAFFNNFTITNSDDQDIGTCYLNIEHDTHYTLESINPKWSDKEFYVSGFSQLKRSERINIF